MTRIAYRYMAMDATGAVREDIISGLDVDDVDKMLRRSGLFPLSIMLASTKSTKSEGKPGIRRKLAEFLRVCANKLDSA